MEKLATKLDVPEDFLIESYEVFQSTGTDAFVLKESSTVYIRSMFSQEYMEITKDTPAETFREALEIKDLDIQDPIIYWDKNFSAVDIDVRPGYEFDQVKLLALEGIPIPTFSWVTKSGGLRLIYVDDEFLAEEIASVAYLCLVNLIPHKNIEIKNDTRHPAYETMDGCCGEVIERLQKFEPSHLRRWLRMFNVEDSEVKEWLISHGLEYNQRYPHSKCPLHPEKESHGDPVVVLDKGIHCFSCEALGETLGSDKPGFFPFTYLCGTCSFDAVYNCMEHGAHWGFAKFVMKSKFNIPEKYARLIYSAGLLLHQWSRTDVKKIISVCPDLIRIDDRWTNLNGELYAKNVRTALQTLPVCKKPEILTAFEQSFDLTKYGYPSLQPIFGYRINPFVNGDITAVIQNRDLSADSMIRYRPAYITSRNNRLENIFPGLNKNFLKLLIAARGIMEGSISMPPMIFVTGPTGSGKSLTIFLAASICGDRNTEVVWTKDIERVRQAIINAKAGSFVTFNEIIKETSAANSSLDFILNLTPDSVSHYIYTGPVRMGRLPVLIWTDTDLPITIQHDAQLARRIIHVQLTRQVEWEESLKAYNVRHPSYFRISSEINAQASNMILSEVIDEFFSTSIHFEDIAEALGFQRLSKSAEALERNKELVKFFSVVCRTSDEKYKEQKGWKLIRQDLATELRSLWQGLCDQNFTTSRRCSEVDWAKLLGMKEPIIFEVRPDGPQRIVVRFKNLSTDKFNQELV